jgi:hypothetical protein
MMKHSYEQPDCWTGYEEWVGYPIWQCWCEECERDGVTPEMFTDDAEV